MRRWVCLGGALLAGCANTPPEAPVQARDPVAHSPAKLDRVEALDSEWEQRMRQVLKGKSVQEQEHILMSEEYLRQALAFKSHGDFSSALDACNRALSEWPSHLEARRLQNELNGILFDRKFGSISDVAAEYRVRIQQMRLEVENHLANGERLYRSKEFEAAEREFRQAEELIRAMPDETSRNAMAQALQARRKRP